jgi:hypothetical protein
MPTDCKVKLPKLQQRQDFTKIMKAVYRGDTIVIRKPLRNEGGSGSLVASEEKNITKDSTGGGFKRRGLEIERVRRGHGEK